MVIATVTIGHFRHSLNLKKPPRPRDQLLVHASGGRGGRSSGGKGPAVGGPGVGGGVAGRRALAKLSVSAKQIYVRQGVGASEAIQISANRGNATVPREVLRFASGIALQHKCEIMTGAPKPLQSGRLTRDRKAIEACGRVDLTNWERLVRFKSKPHPSRCIYERVLAAMVS